MRAKCASCGSHDRIAQNSSSRPGKVAGDVHRQAARLLELLPQVVVARLELEVVEAGVVRDLARRHRQRLQRDARQLQVDQVADALDRADLDLRRKARAQRLARHLRVDREHEGARCAAARRRGSPPRARRACGPAARCGWPSAPAPSTGLRRRSSISGRKQRRQVVVHVGREARPRGARRERSPGRRPAPAPARRSAADAASALRAGARTPARCG